MPPMARALGRGITNRQASYLAALCRELGWKYRGSGMTQLQASDAIAQARDELERRRRGERPRHRATGPHAGRTARGA
jgi:hypothetical protein